MRCKSVISNARRFIKDIFGDFWAICQINFLQMVKWFDFDYEQLKKIYIIAIVNEFRQEQ